MPHNSKDSKLSVRLTAGILLALVVALLVAGEYIKKNFHYTGKGSRSIGIELFFYTPTIVLALTLLPTLIFRHLLWHILFFAALVVCVLVIAFVLNLLFTISPQAPPHIESFLDYLDSFPFLCDLALFIIYLKRR
jgi:hypothetical protein